MKAKISHLAKLSAEQVRAIRRKLRRGVSQSSLARQYGVSQSTIYQIINKKVYRQVA